MWITVNLQALRENEGGARYFRAEEILDLSIDVLDFKKTKQSHPPPPPTLLPEVCLFCMFNTVLKIAR